jgi:hypothetical protein
MSGNSHRKGVRRSSTVWKGISRGLTPKTNVYRKKRPTRSSMRPCVQLFDLRRIAILKIEGKNALREGPG